VPSTIEANQLTALARQSGPVGPSPTVAATCRSRRGRCPCSPRDRAPRDDLVHVEEPSDTFVLTSTCALRKWPALGACAAAAARRRGTSDALLEVVGRECDSSRSGGADARMTPPPHDSRPRAHRWPLSSWRLSFASVAPGRRRGGYDLAAIRGTRRWARGGRRLGNRGGSKSVSSPLVDALNALFLDVV